MRLVIEMNGSRLDKIEKMQVILRDMKSDIKRQDRLNSINRMELTPKQAQKRNAEAAWIAIEQIKRSHELHALSVELGFAERRDNYSAIELTDGWHRFTYKPREPD